MAKWKLSRSAASKLSALVKRFNNKMELLGISNYRAPSYSYLKSSISNKREYNVWIKRLETLFKSGKDKVITNKYGVRYLAWERDELKRANAKANRLRAKKRDELNNLREYAMIPRDEDLEYRTRKYDLRFLYKREYLNNYLQREINRSSNDFYLRREAVFRANLIKSLDVWDNVAPIKELKRIINAADFIDLYVVETDIHFDTTLQGNYHKYYSLTDDEVLQGANELLGKWRYNLAQAKENRLIAEGKK